MNTDKQTQEIVLKQIRKHFQTEKLKFATQNIDNVELLEHRHFLGTELAIRLDCYFYGRKKVHQVEFNFEVPASLWQHFKQVCFPKRLLREFPVKYKIEQKKKTVGAEILFPEIPTSILEHTYTLTVLSNK